MAYYITGPERHFIKYRQISDGIILVSLREVNSSEKNGKVGSLVKEKKFWDDNVY